MLKKPTRKAKANPEPMRRRGMALRATSARPRGSPRTERKTR